MSTNGPQARMTRHVARKLAAGSVVAGMMVATVGAGTALAASGQHGHDRGGHHGHHGDRSGQHRRAVEGVVGTVGQTGFTITHKAGSVNVTVTATTTYVERGQKATLASVVQGERVVVLGTVASKGGGLTAIRVLIKAPEQESVEGIVQSVASNDSGFTIVRDVATVNVGVTSSTTYTLTGGASATFANVKPGERIDAKGSMSGGSFVATSVAISVPPQRAILGSVASIGSTTTSSTTTTTSSTTTSSTSSSFTITAGDGSRPITVNVSSSTVYLEAGVTSANLASLAAGDEVVVVGTGGDGAIQASTVVILSTTPTSPTQTSTTQASTSS